MGDVQPPTNRMPGPPLSRPQRKVAPKPAPAVPTLESLSGVSEAQCSKAISALVAHQSRQQAEQSKNELLGPREEAFVLVVGLKRAAARPKHKPVRLPLPHPLNDPRGPTGKSVCMFVKDPQRRYKDLLAERKINFISRVVGLGKLQKGKHKTLEAKRQLLKEHDLFLVDDRVMPDVGKALGRQFLNAKKLPFPVALSRAELKAELERAISSTYLHIPSGTSLAVKFGSTSAPEHTEQQLVENLVACICQAVARMPNGGWDNVQSLHVKTSSSASLPVYTAPLVDRFANDDDVAKFGASEADAAPDSDEEDEVIEQPSKSAGGKKRKASESAPAAAATKAKGKKSEGKAASASASGNKKAKRS